jgi:hypothetical protein
MIRFVKVSLVIFKKAKIHKMQQLQTELIEIEQKLRNDRVHMPKCFNGDGFYANVTSRCRKFYQCQMTKTVRFTKITEYSCPDLFMFDSETKACKLANLVKCSSYNIK